MPIDRLHPFAEVEKPRDLCLEKPGAAPAEYQELAARVLQTLIRQGVDERAVLMTFPHNSLCLEKQLKLRLQPSVLAALEVEFAAMGLLVRGDRRVEHWPVPSREANAKYFGITKFIVLMSRQLRIQGADVGFFKLLTEAEKNISEKAVRDAFDGAHGRALLMGLARETGAYRAIATLLNKIEPKAIDALETQVRQVKAREKAGKQMPPSILNEDPAAPFSQRRLRQMAERHEALAAVKFKEEERAVRIAVISHLLRAVRVLFDGEYIFMQTYDATSFVSMLIVKELEERFPLEDIIAAINEVFAARPFQRLEIFHADNFGEPTREWLRYLLRYSPHLDRPIRLKIGALLSSAGDVGSQTPNPRQIEDYLRLDASTARMPHRRSTLMRSPSIPVGEGPGGVAQWESLLHDLGYFDTWFKRHGLFVKNWGANPGVNPETLLERINSRRRRPVHFSDCEGFLVF